MMYTENNLVKIAKRENNKKRNYLVVNPLQGKHIPVSAGKAFKMFKELGEIVKSAYAGENILVIGFAETATAIGAAVAEVLDSMYMQTTREIIPEVDYLFFTEDHSHATEQKLVRNDIDKVADVIDRIIFVEDEVTTGNTILNIINILEKRYPQITAYSVASLLNGMDEICLEQYCERKILLHYLVKTNHSQYSDKADGFVYNGTYIKADCKRADMSVINFIQGKSYMNARRLVQMSEYVDANLILWENIKKDIDFKGLKSIAVLGTEECMYPALFIAKQLEDAGKKVLCHSTTRSPIAVSQDENYPLHVRYELKSLYDEDRVTYIYNLEKYECVIIITDADNNNNKGICSFVDSLQQKENENINIVRWCQ